MKITTGIWLDPRISGFRCTVLYSAVIKETRADICNKY